MKTLLSDFSCSVNRDVEHFLRHTALSFDQQGFSTTRLVLASYQGKTIIAGYFTLASKVLVISKSCQLNRRTKDRVKRFGTFNKELNQREIPAPLIAQLGKNDRYKANRLITGDDLLEIATEHVRQALRLLGGRVVYLECEDVPYLLEFYKRNGFLVFDDRQMDSEEQTFMKGTRLMQLIKYFDVEELAPIENDGEIMLGYLDGML